MNYISQKEFTTLSYYTAIVQQVLQMNWQNTFSNLTDEK